MYFLSELRFHTSSSTKLVLKFKFHGNLYSMQEDMYYDVPQRANHGKEHKLKFVYNHDMVFINIYSCYYQR